MLIYARIGIYIYKITFIHWHQFSWFPQIALIRGFFSSLYQKLKVTNQFTEHLHFVGFSYSWWTMKSIPRIITLSQYSVGPDRKQSGNQALNTEEQQNHHNITSLLDISKYNTTEGFRFFLMIKLLMVISCVY